MTIISRPIKTGGGTDFIAGNDTLASEFNAEAELIYADYNGSIENANCSPTMALEGTKLADAPTGIPTNKINDSAVSSAKLASHVSDNAQRAVNTDHIKDSAVTLGKLKNLVVEEFTHVIGVTAGKRQSLTIIEKVNGLNLNIYVIFTEVIAGVVAYTYTTLTPITPIPVASKVIMSMYYRTDSGNWNVGGDTLTGKIVVISVDRA